MNLFRCVAVALLAAGLTACASAPKIRSDYDRSADFSQYKTYGYFAQLGTDRGGYTSLLTRELRTAVDREMQARGYQPSSESPDLLVNFSTKLQDKTDVTTMPSPMMPMGYYGYRGGFYQPWGGYMNETYVTQYTEGTLNVDLVDAKRKQLVWEGVAVGRLHGGEVKQGAVDAAVTQIFSSYPFTAGSGMPKQ